MTNYLYDARGNAVGYISGRYIHSMRGDVPAAGPARTDSPRREDTAARGYLQQAAYRRGVVTFPFPKDVRSEQF
jgi:hypothetical protein